MILNCVEPNDERIHQDRYDWHFIVTGGSIMMDPINRRDLRRNGLIILITADPDVLWARSTAKGIPPWLE